LKATNVMIVNTTTSRTSPATTERRRRASVRTQPIARPNGIAAEVRVWQADDRLRDERRARVVGTIVVMPVLLVAAAVDVGAEAVAWR
jgi:hypothetical protein